MPEKDSDNCAHEERQARSVALEKAYVHDVYDQIAHHLTDNRYRVWPRVKQFLLDLEPGSLVADIGCGNGKYLDINSEVYKIGADRCAPLTQTARRRKYEVLISDNLHLPFRDESFDAALSVAVVHHFATTERRVQALQELARILRIGGRVMITVWAMEQRHRKFESQDVLVPWRRPDKSSSEDRASSAERDLTSTTTSDDDILIYQAYTSDSDANSAASNKPTDKGVDCKRQLFRNAKGQYQACSFDTSCSQSSAEKATPVETCYSFVRRALQKLSNPGGLYMRRQSYFYQKCRTSWFSDSLDSDPGEDSHIELRHLEEEPVMKESVLQKEQSSYRFKSLSDLFHIIPNILWSRKSSGEKEGNRGKRVSTASDPREYARKPGPTLNGIVRSRSTACCMFQYENFHGSEEPKQVVASYSLTSSDIANGNSIIEDHAIHKIMAKEVESISDEEQLHKKDNKSKTEETSQLKILQEQTSVEETLSQQNLSEKASCSSGNEAVDISSSSCHEDLVEEERLVSYWSMPELRFLSTEETSSEYSANLKSEVNEDNFSSQSGVTSSRKSSREEERSSTSEKTNEDDKVKSCSLRNGFVKRSLSVDITVPKHCNDHRRLSSSAAISHSGPVEFKLIPHSSPQWKPVKCDNEETISVVQWKGHSLQSDTSVESDESIISVIYRSPSEIEALAGRAQRGNRSLQASPLTITSSRGGSMESNDMTDFGTNKNLIKYIDAECTEVREILGSVKPFLERNKLQKGLLKSRRSRSTSVDLDFRSESRVAGTKDLRRSSLPCPMYVRKSLEIEEEEEDEDSKNDTVEVFDSKGEDDSGTSKSLTVRRLCRSDPIELSEDELDNLPDDTENEPRELGHTSDIETENENTNPEDETRNIPSDIENEEEEVEQISDTSDTETERENDPEGKHVNLPDDMEDEERDVDQISDTSDVETERENDPEDKQDNLPDDMENEEQEADQVSDTSDVETERENNDSPREVKVTEKLGYVTDKGESNIANNFENLEISQTESGVTDSLEDTKTDQIESNADDLLMLKLEKLIESKIAENKIPKKPVGILKHCCRASSLEERSPKRIGIPRRSLSDDSDPLPPIKELKSPRVRLCLEERPRGGGSISRWNPSLVWHFSPSDTEINGNQSKKGNPGDDDVSPVQQEESAVLIQNDDDDLQQDEEDEMLKTSSSLEEKEIATQKYLKHQSSEENDTSSMQFSRQSSTTSEDYSDLHRHHAGDDSRKSSSDLSKNMKDMMREDSSDHDSSLPTHEAFNHSDSSERKSSYIQESSEDQNQEESFDHDVCSLTASIESKYSEEEPLSHRLRRLSGSQTDKRSRSTDDSDVDLMQTSFTSVPEHSFGKLEILPAPGIDETYDITEWNARNSAEQDDPSLSRNTSLSLSTSQESLVGNESGGPMTYHRYYHVFREGELDHLIETYVENLHIISSYYDHANWCIVAEKVRVWTI